jgi:hypothetical protein
MADRQHDVRRTRAWRRLVQWAKLNLPWVCHLCGERIPRNVHRFHDLAYELDHKLTVSERPDLALHPDNVAPSHRRCNAWRKAKPLTPGLQLEIKERFAVRPPAALDFFGTPPIPTENPGGGRVETPEPPGGPATVIPSGVSPRSL